MDQPECLLDTCERVIEDEETFVQVSGGTVHRRELQHDAGGGHFHPECAIEYIREYYSE